MKISIISTSFNEESIVEKSILSILNQINEYKIDGELIVVDDCSEDNTKSILKKFEDDIKILSTNQNSGGVGAPRNLGIDNAEGDYIMFSDMGDNIFLKNVNEYIDLMDDRLINISIFKHQDIHPCKTISDSPTPIYKETDYITNFTDTPYLISNTFTVSKIFNKLWINKHNIRNGNQYIGEDKLFTWMAYLNASKILVTSNIAYQHVYPENGLNRMNQNNIKCTESLISIDRVLRTKFKNLGHLNIYNNRVLNRDLLGIIFSPNGITKLLNNNHFHASLKLINEWIDIIEKDEPTFKDAVHRENLYKYHLIRSSNYSILSKLDFN